MGWMIAILILDSVILVLEVTDMILEHKKKKKEKNKDANQ